MATRRSPPSKQPQWRRWLLSKEARGVKEAIGDFIRLWRRRRCAMSSGSVRRVQPRCRTLVSGSKVGPFYIQGPVFLSPRPPNEVLKRPKSFSGGRQRNPAALFRQQHPGNGGGARLGPVWGLRSGPAGSAGGGWETGHGEFPAFGFRLFSLKEKKKKFEQKVQACVTDTNLTFCPDREKKQMSH